MIKKQHPSDRYLRRVFNEQKKQEKEYRQSRIRKKLLKESLKEQETQDALQSVAREGNLEGQS